MIFLEQIRHRPDFDPTDGFPFSIPAVNAVDGLSFSAPVTFLVGENGCGKSTLLEAIAAGMRAVAVGSSDIAHDPSLTHARALSRRLRFVRKKRAARTMFFRAEDAFGFTKRLGSEMSDLQTIEQELKEELVDGSYGQKLAMGVARGQHSALTSRYGADPDARSHGENFLHLLMDRVKPNGFYILDEPETPLAPGRILALLSYVREMAKEGCQFLIATHSPILMALPEAEILLIDDDKIEPVPWDEVEHVTLTRSFLANPDAFLRHL